MGKKGENMRKGTENKEKKRKPVEEIVKAKLNVVKSKFAALSEKEKIILLDIGIVFSFSLIGFIALKSVPASNPIPAPTPSSEKEALLNMFLLEGTLFLLYIGACLKYKKEILNIIKITAAIIALLAMAIGLALLINYSMTVDWNPVFHSIVSHVFF